MEANRYVEALATLHIGRLHFVSKSRTVLLFVKAWEEVDCMAMMEDMQVSAVLRDFFTYIQRRSV